MSIATAFWLSLAVGVAYSMVGVSFRLGSCGKVQPMQITCGYCLLGIALFGMRSAEEWARADWAVFIIGAVLGLSQYGVVKLIRYAMQHGPMSPIWCAVMLNFVIGILFAAFFCGESLGIGQMLAVLLGMCAVVNASREEKTAKLADTKRIGWKYGVLLLLILITSGATAIGFKLAGIRLDAAGVPLSESCGNLLLLLLHVFLLIPAVTDLTLSRAWSWRSGYFYGATLLAALGSLTGVGLEMAVMTAPAALVFTVSSSSSILFAALVCTVVFRERRTRQWYGTIAFTLAAILCCNGAYFQEFLFL